MSNKDTTRKARKLAGHIHALLTDPDTPPELHAALEEQAGTLVVELLKTEEWPIEIFEKALTVYMSEEGGEDD